MDWWSLALGWLALGVAADLGPPWVLSVCTVAFGAIHAMLYSRVRAGRRRTDRLMVRASTVGRHASLVVMGLLLMMAGVTVAASLLVAADGAGHPVTIASVMVGLSIPLGGPDAMAVIRRNAASGT